MLASCDCQSEAVTLTKMVNQRDSFVLVGCMTMAPIRPWLRGFNVTTGNTGNVVSTNPDFNSDGETDGQSDRILRLK